MYLLTEYNHGGFGLWYFFTVGRVGFWFWFGFVAHSLDYLT